MSTYTNVIKEPKSEYSHLTVTSDDINNITWCEMSNQKACFTQELLDELSISLNNFTNNHQQKFFVLSSASQTVFSFGGDLTLFRKLTKEQNKQALYLYMKQCIETLYSIAMLPACERIALVRGTAFGGGFEAALACDTIIAEKNAKFGFPDRLFNSFPGMGAYSYLVRRVTPATAQKIIKSAKSYSAEELYDMGIVDKVIPDGDGYDAVYNHIQHYKRYSNSYDSLKHVFHSVHPINYDELLQIGELWVDTVLGLSDKDMGLMERLAMSQSQIVGSN